MIPLLASPQQRCLHLVLAALGATANVVASAELPTYSFASGTTGYVVGQSFATAPISLGDGTVLRTGFWSGIRPTAVPTSLKNSPKPVLSGGWLRLDRTRLDLKPTSLGASQAFLSETPKANCAEASDCIGFAVRLEKPLRLDIALFDLLGVPVGFWSRRFSREEIALRQGSSIDAWLDLGWNGRSAAGRLVGSGVYLIRVRKSFDNGETAEEILKVGLRTP